MKQPLKRTLNALAAALAAAWGAWASPHAHAGVAVKWAAETSRVHPEIIEAWRGDTLDLSCTLKSYGRPVTNGAATASFMWQTNGMGNAWWQTNATVTTGGVVRATWSPTMDPGAAEVAFFMPVQSAGGASYRAAGRIRFRPSPGAGSQIIDLPQPGGTLDFSAYQLVNAPWATLEAVNSAIDANNAIIDAAIAGATGAIVIPPPVDLGPYATTGMVAAAVQSSGNALAGQISAVSNAAMQRAEMGDYATKQDVSTAIAGIPIPSLAGYATEQYVGDYFAANYTPPDLSSYASRSYADAAASNAQASAIAAIPSLAGYATEQYVGDAIAAITLPDLSSYASRSYADAAASNAQATAMAAIPSLSGYATEQYVGDYFATNYTPPDLSSYASRSYADAAASNAQATAIAAIPSLAGYATETYAQGAAESAASGALAAAQDYALGLSWAASEGNTRLVTPDGTVWQDATGTVWQVSYIFGWRGTWVDLSTSAAEPISFLPYAGPPPAEYVSNVWWTAGGGTNIFIDIEQNTFLMESPAFGTMSYLADGSPPLDATNITFTTPEYYYSLFYRPVALATNPVDRVLYESSGAGAPGNYEVVSNKAMSAVQPAALSDKRDYSDLSVTTNAWYIVNPDGSKEWLQKDPLHPNFWSNGDDSRYLAWSSSQGWFFVPDQHHNEGECNYDRSSPYTATSLTFSFDYTGTLQTYRLFRGTRLAFAEEVPGNYEVVSNKAMSAVQPAALSDKRDYSDLSVTTNAWYIVNPDGSKEWLQKDPLHPNFWSNGDDSRCLAWSSSQGWFFVPDQHHNEGECNYDRSSPYTATSLTFSFDYTGTLQTYRLFRGTRLAFAEEVPGNYAAISNRAMNADGNFLAVDGPFGWEASKGISLKDGYLNLDNTSTGGGLLQMTYQSVTLVGSTAQWDSIIEAANAHAEGLIATTGALADAAEAATNYTNAAIADADTTYRRTVGVTNLNQSVQYVNITDAAPSTLQIQLPTNGETKDWMVYVHAATNVTISLPPATWWMADVAYTNAVPGGKPTALWFSQISDGIYILGRQELTEVQLP